MSAGGQNPNSPSPPACQLLSAADIGSDAVEPEHLRSGDPASQNAALCCRRSDKGTVAGATPAPPQSQFSAEVVFLPANTAVFAGAAGRPYSNRGRIPPHSPLVIGSHRQGSTVV
jgi:hypothetical protein